MRDTASRLVALSVTGTRRYSLTIGIAFLFVVVKSLSYFGIIDTASKSVS